MDRLFKHLPFMFTYLDDHIIASRTLEEHHEHLREFFTILQESCLQINPVKCVFTAGSHSLYYRERKEYINPQLLALKKKKNHQTSHFGHAPLSIK